MALPALAGAAGERDRLGGVQDRLGHAQDRLRAKDRRAELLTSDLSALNGRVRGLEVRLAGLRADSASAQRLLDAALVELTSRQRRLRAERARLSRLRSRLAQAQRVLAVRLVARYKADEPDLLTVVLNADGFARLLDEGTFLRRIGRQDQRIIVTVRAARRDAVRQTVRLKRLEARQQTVAAGRQRKRDELRRLQQGVAATRSALARTQASRRRQLGATRTSRREFVSEVADLRDQQARIQHTLVAAQASARLPVPKAGPVQAGASGWVWPVDGTITSPFCERRSYEACHPGMDIGVAEGTPIRAAKAGRVVLLQPTSASGGYGNYTCIQHDAATSSCYAHQSRFGTSMGASVQTGQVIGYVGNTGNSSGAHLHFEVRVNGTVVNPLDYL